MIIKLLSIIVLIHAARSKPQFLTFDNGKIGVNFGGYHAEAGLGGLLTGNAAHGGLSASAGTPNGQIAGAGLGGSLDGRTAGGLYAGASAGNGIGASAALGGGLGGSGGHGGALAESHVGSVSKKVVKLAETQPQSVKTVTYVDEIPPSVDATYNKGFSASSTFNAQSSINSGINGLSSIGSTYNAQPPAGSGYIDTAPQQVYVQKFKKRLHHHHHFAPSHSKVLTIEKRVQVPQYETNTQTYTQTNIVQPGWGQQQQQQQGVGFDYRKFFDFGFFANTAAGFGGGQQPQNVQTVAVEKQPQVTYEQRIVPKVVYEKRIVPQVVVEKKIVPETVIVEKTIQPAPVTFSKEVKVEKPIESDVNGSIGGTQSTYSGGNSHSHFGYSGDFNHQGGSKIFDDIFNIPIATLQAVNRLVSNKAASSHSGSIDINKTITVNHN